MLDGINMLDGKFQDIDKHVVPNKHVGKKLRNVSQYKLVAIFWFDSTF